MDAIKAVRMYSENCELSAFACCQSVLKSLLLPCLKLEEFWIIKCLSSVMWLALNN